MVMFLRSLLFCSLAGSALGFGIPHDPTHLADVASHGAMTVAGAAGKFANTYKDSLVEHPLLTKMATGGLLASAGDAIAQSRTEDPYDKPRALSFMAFDMCYRALQHVAFPIIVHQCHGQFLGPLVTQLPTDYAAAMEQTLASQLGIVPFLYYPIFFAVSGAIQGLTADAAVDRAKENFLPLMKRNLLFWIPVQFVQFGFIDEQLQIPFLSVAGLCWTFILSAAAGSAKGYNNSQDQIAQQEASAEESATPVYTMTASARVSN